MGLRLGVVWWFACELGCGGFTPLLVALVIGLLLICGWFSVWFGCCGFVIRLL